MVFFHRKILSGGVKMVYSKVHIRSVRNYHTNNNVICLENNVSAYGAEFHIEQDNNCLNIKKGTTFHGRNGYPVHIALDEGSSITINEDCMFSNGIQIRSTDSHSIIDSTGKRINYAALENIRKTSNGMWISIS